jgi:hypothetical protein
MAYQKAQSLVGIIVVLVVVGLITSGLYLYLSKQIPEISEIVEKPTEEEITEKEITKPEVTCQDECSPIYSQRCFEEGLQVCGYYDGDDCLKWGPIINCPANNVCRNGECVRTPASLEATTPIIQKCTDGTSYNQCSTNKPKYCEAGNLINRCSICGCPSGQYCDRSSNLCYVGEKLDMLIFLSPQYANDLRIKEAINVYIEAVKEDINWNTEIIALTSVNNDFQEN